MRVDKLIKKFDRGIHKNPNIKATLDELTEYGVDGGKEYRHTIGPKNKQAFRFFRDQFYGEIQSDIDWVYKIGGSMKLKYRSCIEHEHDIIDIQLFDDHGKGYAHHTLTCGQTA